MSPEDLAAPAGDGQTATHRARLAQLVWPSPSGQDVLRTARHVPLPPVPSVKVPWKMVLAALIVPTQLQSSSGDTPLKVTRM
jgi:hypothetical protein